MKEHKQAILKALVQPKKKKKKPSDNFFPKTNESKRLNQRRRTETEAESKQATENGKTSSQNDGDFAGQEL